MRFKMALCIPTAGMVHGRTLYSVVQILSKLYTTQLFTEGGEQSLTFFMEEGSGINANRDSMVEKALADGCTHILFLDDDMRVYDAEAVVLMANRRQPIVVTNYRKRHPPAEFVAIHKQEKDGEHFRVAINAGVRGLIPVEFSGFGLSLIAREVFEAVPRPRFLNQFINGEYTSEDAPFFAKARELGFTVWCDLDASRMIGHIGTYEYKWDQPWETAK